MTTKSFESLVKNTHKTLKKEVGIVNFCEGCKHLHLDGMFDFWCDKNHDWTLVNGNCSDFER